MVLFLFLTCGDSPDPSSAVLRAVFYLQQWVYGTPSTPILLSSHPQLHKVVPYGVSNAAHREWNENNKDRTSHRPNSFETIKPAIKESIEKVKQCRGHGILPLMGRRTLRLFFLFLLSKGSTAIKRRKLTTSSSAFRISVEDIYEVFSFSPWNYLLKQFCSHSEYIQSKMTYTLRVTFPTDDVQKAALQNVPLCAEPSEQLSRPLDQAV